MSAVLTTVLFAEDASLDRAERYRIGRRDRMKAVSNSGKSMHHVIIILPDNQQLTVPQVLVSSESYTFFPLYHV